MGKGAFEKVRKQWVGCGHLEIRSKEMPGRESQSFESKLPALEETT